MPFLSSRAMAMWMVLLVTPALFSLNMLISRLVAGWLPPVNLTFWRWFLTALFAGAIAGLAGCAGASAAGAGAAEASAAGRTSAGGIISCAAYAPQKCTI